MATAAERARQRDGGSRATGETDVNVRVPISARERLDELVQGLREGLPISPRLICALAVLRDQKDALDRLGVARAGIFGSVARGEDSAASDIDVLLVLKPDPSRDVFDLVAIRRSVFDAFAGVFPDVTVDVAFHKNLKPDIRVRADAEAVYPY